MLGSLGMASSIGLGLAIATDRSIYVLDGDGSILMNPNALITAAACADCGHLRGALTIICLDNGVHGSTGDQCTYSGRTLELPLLAKGAGIEDTCSAVDEETLRRLLGSETEQGKEMGTTAKLRFIHVRVGSGNAEVGVIPLGGREIKKRFVKYLRDKN
jgi:sulfopyruvate decarboxylase subunit beta